MRLSQFFRWARFIHAQKFAVSKVGDDEPRIDD